MAMFESYSNAQKVLLVDLFSTYSVPHSDGTKVLPKEGIKFFLAQNDIDYTESELQEFIEIAKFGDSEYGKDEIGEIEFYQNVHAHYLFSDEHERGIIRKI